MAPTTPQDLERREALAQWMKTNGVDTATVSLHSAFRITTTEDGQRLIHYTAYERDFADRTVPCTVDPPDWLNIPIDQPALFDIPGGAR
ncbi:hypothetical protein ACFQ6Q_00045 [Streptomyces sp. NPDC056437]|uniref:hypothetical protein n=1 Tax=Streptomyces sp. NPDC056437 TaxID=3345816 RepID=UPI003680A84B